MHAQRGGVGLLQAAREGELVKGRELRKWRTDQFLSQPELAALLGVHYTSVANWEQGRALPPEQMLDLALEAISGHRERQVRALRAARERLAHHRRLKEIAQGLPERRAAARKAGSIAARESQSSRPRAVTA